MKNSLKILIVFLLFLMTGLIEPLAALYAQKDRELTVYVWDFSVRYDDLSGVSLDDLKKYAKVYRNDFETELIKLKKYRVIDRRRNDRIIAHNEMENKISDTRNLTPTARDSLKANKADAVFFGKLIYNDESGKYQVTMTFQNLKGTILRQGDKIVDKAKIDDIEVSKIFMKELLKDLYAEELFAAKKAQFDLVSKLLNSYLAEIKEVHMAFTDIADLALIKQEYFNELVDNIRAYNAVWDNMNSNRETYLMDFEISWGQPYTGEFEDIYVLIMDKIHKAQILSSVNGVLTKIRNYKEENKKQKEKIKDDIDKTALGLNNAIIGLEKDIETFIKVLKNNM